MQAGPVEPKVTLESSPQTSSEGDELTTYNASIKILRSTDKKEFTMYTLRSITAEHFVTPRYTQRRDISSVGKDRGFQ